MTDGDGPILIYRMYSFLVCYTSLTLFFADYYTSSGSFVCNCYILFQKLTYIFDLAGNQQARLLQWLAGMYFV